MFLNEWVLASRIRYALVQTAINAGVVLGLIALVNGISAMREGWGVIAFVVAVAFVLNGWVWYPRAKRKFTAQHG